MRAAIAFVLLVACSDSGADLNSDTLGSAWHERVPCDITESGMCERACVDYLTTSEFTPCTIDVGEGGFLAGRRVDQSVEYINVRGVCAPEYQETTDPADPNPPQRHDTLVFLTCSQ